jgi:predicted nucleic acid-binding protein
LDKKKITHFIDTNIFIIDLRYRRDRHFKINRLFLDFVARQGKGITSIINLLEVCGILSFNLNRQQIMELFYYFPKRYNVDILPSHELDSFLPETPVEALIEVIYKKASFGDALVANIVQGSMTEDGLFLSWDAAHFKHLLSVRTLTPAEFLQSRDRNE